MIVKKCAHCARAVSTRATCASHHADISREFDFISAFGKVPTNYYYYTTMLYSIVVAMMNEFMHAASAYRENYVRSQMCLRAQVILVCCSN